jgi:hypothetical protein
MGLIQIHLYFSDINYVVYDNGFAEPYHYKKLQRVGCFKSYAVYLNNPLLF